MAGTRYEGLTMGYIAGFAAMVTHGIGANTFIIVRIMEPFWFMTGIIAVLPTLLEKEETQRTPHARGAVPAEAIAAHRRDGIMMRSFADTSRQRQQPNAYRCLDRQYAQESWRHNGTPAW